MFDGLTNRLSRIMGSVRERGRLNEGEFLVEVLDPQTMEPADEGELVITNLGRIGSPEAGRTFDKEA